MALLLVQAGVYYTISAKEVIPQIAPWSLFPPVISEWHALADEPVDEEALTELKPDDYLYRDYVAPGGKSLSLFVGYFNSRRNGRAPHSPEWCLPGSGWKTESTRTVSIPTSSGALPANEYLVERAPERELVVYWYHQGDRALASEVMAQFYAIPQMILHGRTDTSLIRIITSVQGSQVQEARDEAFRFAADILPLIERQIR